MKDQDKTKEQLTNELMELRRRVAELEAVDAECQRMEEALQESKRQLESRERFIASILDSIPTSLLVIDRSLRVASVNRNFLEKTRREEQATLGRRIEEVFPQVLLQYTQLDQKVRKASRPEPQRGGGGEDPFRDPTSLIHHRESAQVCPSP